MAARRALAPGADWLLCVSFSFGRYCIMSCCFCIIYLLKLPSQPCCLLYHNEARSVALGLLVSIKVPHSHVCLRFDSLRDPPLSLSCHVTTRWPLWLGRRILPFMKRTEPQSKIRCENLHICGNVKRWYFREENRLTQQREGIRATIAEEFPSNQLGLYQFN